MTGVKAQAEALLLGITPGPWLTQNDMNHLGFVYALNSRGVNRMSLGVNTGHDDDGARTQVSESHANARLIAAAPTLARQVVELAGEVQRLRAENAALRRGQDSGFITLHRPFPPRKRIEDLPISKLTQEPCHDD